MTIFRADGDLSKPFKDNVLQPRLRAAISSTMTGIAAAGSASKLDSVLSTLSAPDRQPVSFVPWTRQSNEDGGRARDSIPRQLTTLLDAPILEMLRANDNLLIIAEICSSNKHPMKDRQMWHPLPRNRPVYLLTVNPDRVTRRTGEVAQVLSRLDVRGGAWLTQGFPSGEAMDETNSEVMDKTDWQLVTQDTSSGLEAQLTLGRQRALQMGFYWRRDEVMIRLNNHVDRTGSSPRSLVALQKAPKVAIEVHEFDAVLLVARVSPTSQAKEDNSMNTSILRQSKFLSTVVAQCGVPVHSLNCTSVSAHSNGLVEILKSKLKTLNERVLVVSVGVDSLCHSSETYLDLVNMSYDGVGFGSLLWDHDTTVDVCTALRLDYCPR